MDKFININSIVEIHQILGLESPEHPLISVINMENPKLKKDFGENNYVLNLFHIGLKIGDINAFGYGRNSYDFQDGSMVFISPGQVIRPESQDNNITSGWMLFFHPDLLRQSDLSNKMDEYNFFSYHLNEALHLSRKEKMNVTDLINKIEEEYNQNIDKHSQPVIISTLELLLNYATRYYDRQFSTRTNNHKKYINQFETLLKNYYKSNKHIETGIPTVAYCGDSLNMSAKYLSDLLRKETGRNTQDHIHEFIIEKGKNKLLNSTTSISEIAYDLGFEYPQYFSKLFKKTTNLSPSEYRILN
jgi:AraC-like DNA-binding protein